jgi:hypothetical protein
MCLLFRLQSAVTRLLTSIAWPVAVLVTSGSLFGQCTISSMPLSTGNVGVAYDVTIVTSCGSGLSFSIAEGALPLGLQLVGNGKITGTPLYQGRYYTKIAVQGSAGSASTVYWTEVVLSGAAPQPAASQMHTVTLSWTAPTPAPTSYSLYRATSLGGPYTRVVLGVTSTTWKDSVPGGMTYYYVATSVKGNQESTSSNVAKAVVP